MANLTGWESVDHLISESERLNKETELIEEKISLALGTATSTTVFSLKNFLSDLFQNKSRGHL